MIPPCAIYISDCLHGFARIRRRGWTLLIFFSSTPRFSSFWAALTLHGLPTFRLRIGKVGLHGLVWMGFYSCLRVHPWDFCFTSTRLGSRYRLSNGINLRVLHTDFRVTLSGVQFSALNFLNTT
ncbi:hypothetical protein IQ07DRAFT_286375 [Pyrenochaeta sp. DS3sAY3a]|nr:hypothetical protein IQ07DRAFT_286375 [Pyrenochaeta sp. DS3sAY3a]